MSDGANGGRSDEQMLGTLDLLWNFVRFDDGPHEGILRALLAEDPHRVSWLVAPTGGALGVHVAGRGEGFFEAVGDQVGALLDRSAAEVFGELVDRRQPAMADVEFVLGDPDWFSAGIPVDEFDALEELLASMDASPDQRERALRYRDTPGATLQGLHLKASRPDPWGVQVNTGLDPTAPDRPGGDAVGDEPLVVHEVINDFGRTWLRRPGLSDRDLIEWQDDRGFGTDEAGTVGEIQGALGVHGPEFMVWEEGKLRETLVYVYDDAAVE